MEFFNIHSVAKYQRNERDPLETSKYFRKKSHKAEKRENFIVSKKWNGVTLLLWNGFVFHVRGFGCIQNEELSTNGKVHRSR